MGDNPPSSLSTEPPAADSEGGSIVRNRSPSAISMSSAAGALEWDPSADVGAAGTHSSSGAKSCDLEYSLMFRTAYPVEPTNFPLRKCKSGPPTISTPSASPPAPLDSLVHSPIPQSSSSSRVQNLKVIETPSVAEVESNHTKDDTLCDNPVTTSSDDNNQNTAGRRSRSPRVVSDVSTSWEYDNEKYFPPKSMDWQVLGLTRSEIEYQNRKNSGCSTSVSSSLLVFDGDPSKKNDAYSEHDSKATKTQRTAVAHSSRTSHSDSEHKAFNIKRPEPRSSRGHKAHLGDSTETPSSDPSTMCMLVAEFGNIVEGTSKENMKYDVLKKHRDLHVRRVFRQIKRLESLNEKLLLVTGKTHVKRKPTKETDNSSTSYTTTSNHRDRDIHHQKHNKHEVYDVSGAHKNQQIGNSKTSHFDFLEQNIGARLISKKGSSHPQLNKPEVNKRSQDFVITSENELRHRAEKQYTLLKSVGTQHSRQASILEHEQSQPNRKQRRHPEPDNDRGDYSRKENIPEKQSAPGEVKGLKIMIRKNWDGSEDRVVLGKHDKNGSDYDDKPRKKVVEQKSLINKSVDTGGLFKVKSTGVNTTAKHHKSQRRHELSSSKKKTTYGLNSRFTRMERQRMKANDDNTHSYSDSSDASDVPPESGYSDTEAEVKLMPPVAFYVPLFSMTASPSGSSVLQENKEKTGTYSKKSKWVCDKLDSGLYNVEGPKRIQDCFKEDYAKCYQNVQKRSEVVTTAKKVRESRVAAEEIKWYLDWYEDHAMKRGTKSSQEYELLAKKYKDLMADKEDFDKSIHVISEREMKERTARLMQHDVIAMQQRWCDVEMRKKKTSRIIQQIFSNNLRIRQKQQGPNVPERMKLTRK